MSAHELAVKIVSPGIEHAAGRLRPERPVGGPVIARRNMEKEKSSGLVEILEVGLRNQSFQMNQIITVKDVMKFTSN